MRRLPDLSEMEHITSIEFGENMDKIIDRIVGEDIAMVIDHLDKSYVICPATWFDIPKMKSIEAMLRNAVRYAALVDDADIKETVEMVQEFLPALSRDCIESLLDTIKDNQKGELWAELKDALKDELSTIKKEE